MGDMSSAYELSQQMYVTFPNEKIVLNHLMTDAYLLGFHDVNGKKKHYLEMSISVAQRFLTITDDLEEQSRCIKNIAVCNKLLGNQEKALEWFQKLPSIWSGIESASLSILDGKDKIDMVQCNMDALLHLLHRCLYIYAMEGELSREERIRVFEKELGIYGLLFDQEEYGWHWNFITAVYIELARLYGKENESGRIYAKKAMEGARKFDTLQNGQYSSLLFRGQGIEPAMFTKAISLTRTEYVVQKLAEYGFVEN